MLTFYNKRIASIITILPSKVVRYEDELNDYPFPVKQSQMLGKMMDYHTRRQCELGDSVSEYAEQGIRSLINKGVLCKSDIEAILVATSSQDYIMPSISYLLQGRLDLDEHVYCSDIVQQCGGFVFGLMHSFMLMDTMGLKKVVLVTGEMTSKKVGLHDRNTRPIIGDAVAVTIVEQFSSLPIYVQYKNYGQLAEKIIIPAGGLKKPSTIDTAIEVTDDNGNMRAQDNFYMDGEAVFNFVMTKVPPMLEQLFIESGVTKSNVDYFMFHQPNKYMVERLADELDIPSEKCFSNIVGIYGNSSTATIPLNICHNIGILACKKSLSLCLSGFGGGLTCNGMIIHNPKMDYCGIEDYKQ